MSIEPRATAPTRPSRAPRWLAAVGPLALIAVLAALLIGFGVPGLERTGPPIERVAVERVELRPGTIALRVRNDGPDQVRLAQVIVNDAYVPVAGLGDDPLGRLEAQTVRVPFDWIEGEAYEIALVTSTGATLPATIEAAVQTPEVGGGLFGTLALVGLYVGLLPVVLGMLWLPAARRASPQALRFVLALTVGVLVFLGIEALVDGIEIAGRGAQSLGGAALPLIGAVAGLAAVTAGEGLVPRRAGGGIRLAVLIAIGIGLHNLGEGLAIGGAYATGELALGTLLVVGFALHNTTEGLAVVSPLTSERPSVRSLALLGLIAGGPVTLGAWVGSLAANPTLVALLLGIAAGAIAQVVIRLAPRLKAPGAGLDAVASLGLLAGLAIMYMTGLIAASV